jgi:hypothetical protein
MSEHADYPQVELVIRIIKRDLVIDFGHIIRNTDVQSEQEEQKY